MTLIAQNTIVRINHPTTWAALHKARHFYHTNLLLKYNFPMHKVPPRINNVCCRCIFLDTPSVIQSVVHFQSASSAQTPYSFWYQGIDSLNYDPRLIFSWVFYEHPHRLLKSAYAGWARCQAWGRGSNPQSKCSYNDCVK